MTYYFLSVKCFIGVNPFCTALAFNLVCLCLMVVRHVSQIFLWFCHIVFDGLRKEESIFCLVLPPRYSHQVSFFACCTDTPIAPPLPSMPSSSSFCNGNFCAAPYFVQFHEREKNQRRKWWFMMNKIQIILLLIKCELFFRETKDDEMMNVSSLISLGRKW